MAKVLYCNDVVPWCRFEARGESEKELIAEYGDHLATAHNMPEISEEILAMVSKVILEEVRGQGRAAPAQSAFRAASSMRRCTVRIVDRGVGMGEGSHLICVG